MKNRCAALDASSALQARDGRAQFLSFYFRIARFELQCQLRHAPPGGAPVVTLNDQGHEPTPSSRHGPGAPGISKRPPRFLKRNRLWRVRIREMQELDRSPVEAAASVNLATGLLCWKRIPQKAILVSTPASHRLRPGAVFAAALPHYLS